VKHFGVRNNIEKGKGELLTQTVSRFAARIEAKQILIAITTCNANKNIELEFYW